jgi:hypothetical protein
MARFKYLGEPPRPELVKVMGDSVLFRVVKLGGVQEYVPVPPKTKFEVNEDIGYDITDTFSLLAMRGNPRFEEIV